MNKKYKQFIAQVNKFTWKDLRYDELKKVITTCDKSNTPLVYSVIKEIIFRITGLDLFDSQLITAYAMERGKIAQLPTGEGKTLSAVITACSLAFRGHKVHVMTFNDYLAKRDYLDHKDIFAFFGLTCGCIVEGTTLSDRKHIYTNNIVYTTAKEIGFDYLRNFMIMKADEFLALPFDVAIIDEADSILIDEARIPLVIASDIGHSTGLKYHIDKIVKSFSSVELIYDIETKKFYLSEEGVENIEELLNISNLYSSEHMDTLSLVTASIEANYSLSLNHDYIIKDNQVMVVDQITGRIAYNRRFPDLVHQAVQIKEGLKEDATTIICNSMPLQFFLLKYSRLCGMTGTAKTSKKELKLLYNLEVEVILPHTPCIRKDYNNQIFLYEKEKEQAIIMQVLNCYSQGQPVLIGTQSVKESERYSLLLTKNKLPHYVLNAKNDQEEAKIIHKAGENNAITISTNMAGRGVDIKTSHPKGLFIIGCGMNISRRIDQQLIGRSGRQGHAGESKFYISREEPNMAGWNKTAEQLQRILEGQAAEMRYMLSKYAYIIELQRQAITIYRDAILFDSNLPLAEKQLTLYFINQHWSDYLSTMENIRAGIHLSILGGLNPIDEYNKASVAAFAEMKKEIEIDIETYLQKCHDKQFDIDLEQLGLPNPSSTYSYMINESVIQFSKQKNKK